MTRYYFDLEFAQDAPSMDEEGMELPDASAAQAEATRTLCDVANQILAGGDQLVMLAVNVRDDAGPVLSAGINFRIGRVQ